MGNQSRDMGLYQDDDGTGYLLSENVCSLLTYCMKIGILMNIATTRLTHLQTDKRLLKSRVTNLHVPRKVRIASHPQKRRRLLHVRLPPDRLGIKRQPLLNRYLALRSLDTMDEFCTCWKQDFQLANHVHPPYQQRSGHLYG